MQKHCFSHTNIFSMNVTHISSLCFVFSSFNLCCSHNFVFLLIFFNTNYFQLTAIGELSPTAWQEILFNSTTPGNTSLVPGRFHGPDRNISLPLHIFSEHIICEGVTHVNNTHNTTQLHRLIFRVILSLSKQIYNTHRWGRISINTTDTRVEGINRNSENQNKPE